MYFKEKKTNRKMANSPMGEQELLVQRIDLVKKKTSLEDTTATLHFPW